MNTMFEEKMTIDGVTVKWDHTQYRVLTELSYNESR